MYRMHCPPRRLRHRRYYTVSAAAPAPLLLLLPPRVTRTHHTHTHTTHIQMHTTRRTAHARLFQRGSRDIDAYSSTNILPLL